MKTAITITAIAVVAVLVNNKLSERDAQTIRSASLYEQCVKAEYGMTPIRYYEDNHKYPVCGN